MVKKEFDQYKERYKIKVKNAELKNSYNYENTYAREKIDITIEGTITLF